VQDMFKSQDKFKNGCTPIQWVTFSFAKTYFLTLVLNQNSV